MKNTLYTLIIFIATSVICCGAPDLIGSWKSNKELTLKSVRIDPSIEGELKKKIEALFGCMTVTYERKHATIYMTDDNGKTEEIKNTYSVVASTSKKIILRWKDPSTGKEENTTLTFVSPDRYWVELPTTPKLSGREYFDRQN